MTQQNPDNYDRRDVLRKGAVGVATVATAGLTTGTATAETNPPESGVLADGFEGGDFWSFATGLRERVTPSVSRPDTPATLADRMRNEFNANSGLWIDYGNWLLDEQGVEPIGTATVAVEVAITRTRSLTTTGDAQTTIDVIYDDDAEEFTDLKWRLEEAEDPTYHVQVRNNAAERAADELSEFRRRFIDEDGDHELPDEEYVSRLAGRYGGGLRIGEDSKHVLELLLGEFRNE